MEFEWNPVKAALNLRKHDVELAGAIGRDALGRILVVVFAWRDTKIRLISARRATRRERREYLG